jgi:hypothetical protein
MQSCLIFHYNLKFYDSDEDSFDGVSLKRFVMQSVIGNIVAFRVHAPCSGAFLLDIFANAVTPQEYLTGEPMKFKSVCKFKVSKIHEIFNVLSSYFMCLKICCEELQTVMVPLPDCASGEWGPTKATRLFGLVPITHQVKPDNFQRTSRKYITICLMFSGAIDLCRKNSGNTVQNVTCFDRFYGNSSQKWNRREEVVKIRSTFGS